MEYGYFDDSAREYIITSPCTPTKWINYVGNYHNRTIQYDLGLFPQRTFLSQQ